DLRARANSLHSVRLSERALCDLELLATGAFSPLDGFMRRADYFRVMDEMRLVCDHLFPIPVTLPVEPDEKIREGAEIALRNLKNEALAVMKIEEVYEWDVSETARKVFGTTDLRHPLVAEMHGWGSMNISGSIKVISLPRYYD